MPNNVQNRLIIKADMLDVDNILFQIKEKGLVQEPRVIDFRNIIPQPEDLVTDGVDIRTEEILKKYGVPYWYDWNIENWGSKWNAYDTTIKNCNEVWFQTAWSDVSPVIKALSKQYPNIEFDYTWSDENEAYNIGHCAYIGGEEVSLDIIKEDSLQAWDLYFELHPGRKERYRLIGDSYEYIDEEDWIDNELV